jgi:elongation factor G
MVQVPIGLEEEHVGVCDLVTMKAWYFEGENGETIREEEIPAELLEECESRREILLDAVSMFDDDLMEAMLEETVTPELMDKAIRTATISREITPVLCGSAYKNKGVQALLDCVNKWLPAPTDVVNEAIDMDQSTEGNEVMVEVPSDGDKPLVALAFKLEDGRYGQLTYLRVYQGCMKKGEFMYNLRDRKKVKIGRLVRMHSDEMEDIDEASAGDIVATFGVDCYSGDTFTDGNCDFAMSSMFVPNPVISLTITPKDAKAQVNMSKALQRFTKEDPTFRVSSDKETKETIMAGMGELQLEVYVERMKREYGAEVVTSPPRVAYREAITKRADFDYTHKKQTGGSGQFGRVVGYVEPGEELDYEFVDQIKGGVIPREYIPSCDKGFKSMMTKGRLIEAPVTNVRIVLNDGNYHNVDSSDMAFQAAAQGAWREVYQRAKPIILEPVMKVQIEGPIEFHGGMVATMMQRRGVVSGVQEESNYCQIDAEVPLSEMFGYATVIRSATQGKAEFTMEFARYAPVPNSVQAEIIEQWQKEKDEK